MAVFVVSAAKKGMNVTLRVITFLKRMMNVYMNLRMMTYGGTTKASIK